LNISKEYITNLIALGVVSSSFFAPHSISTPIFYTGLFALSGSLTNQIAIHMLFNKVPFFYGSGIIELKFEELKLSIKSMIIDEFFSKQKIEEFLNDEEQKINLTPLIEKFDFSSAFEALLAAINESKFANLINMIGGPSALETLREPFNTKLKSVIVKLTSSTEFNTELQAYINNSSFSDDILQKIDGIVQKRLDELSPNMIKDMLQNLMREHLGWLVVWGGVFGGLIGLVSSLLESFIR